MKICFSCRVAHNTDALMLNVDSDQVCAGCFRKWSADKKRLGEDMTFAGWRKGQAVESFGFDPYFDRDATVQMEAADAAALISLSAETMGLLENMREIAPSLDADDIIHQALEALQARIDTKVSEALERDQMAQMIGAAVAEALGRGE